MGQDFLSLAEFTKQDRQKEWPHSVVMGIFITDIHMGQFRSSGNSICILYFMKSLSNSIRALLFVNQLYHFDEQDIIQFYFADLQKFDLYSRQLGHQKMFIDNQTDKNFVNPQTTARDTSTSKDKEQARYNQVSTSNDVLQDVSQNSSLSVEKSGFNFQQQDQNSYYEESLAAQQSHIQRQELRRRTCQSRNKNWGGQQTEITLNQYTQNQTQIKNQETTRRKPADERLENGVKQIQESSYNRELFSLRQSSSFGGNYISDQVENILDLLGESFEVRNSMKPEQSYRQVMQFLKDLASSDNEAVQTKYGYALDLVEKGQNQTIDQSYIQKLQKWKVYAFNQLRLGSHLYNEDLQILFSLEWQQLRCLKISMEDEWDNLNLEVLKNNQIENNLLKIQIQGEKLPISLAESLQRLKLPRLETLVLKFDRISKKAAFKLKSAVEKFNSECEVIYQSSELQPLLKHERIKQNKISQVVSSRHLENLGGLKTNEEFKQNVKKAVEEERIRKQKKREQKLKKNLSLISQYVNNQNIEKTQQLFNRIQKNSLKKLTGFYKKDKCKKQKS